MKQLESLRQEHGLFLPLVALMIFTLIAIVGLAVDAGNLQHARLELQKAADAAAIAAAKKFALLAYEERDSSFSARVRAFASKVLNANLVAAHGAGTSQVQVDVDLDDETLQVSSIWDVRLYILGNFPGYTPTMPVQVKAKAQVRKAMVSLILDTSYSMWCPARNPDCTCTRLYPFVCSNPKALHMIWAVQDFVHLFNPNRDMFDMTWFSVAARTDFDMCNRELPSLPCESGGFSLDDPSTGDGLLQHIESILTERHLQGSTNTCDGLFRSYVGTMEPTRQQHRSNVGRVLFTDGAPAAARFFLSGAIPGVLPVNNRFGGGPEFDYDYYNWAVDWLTQEQFMGTDSSPGIPGCTALGKATIPYSWPRGAIPNFAANEFFPAEDGDTTAWFRTVPCSVSDKNQPEVAFISCLQHFGFYTPDGQRWGESLTLYPFSNYRQHYFHCAIAMSDFLRKEGSIIYGLAIGATPPATTDPYQSILDDNIRKDCFMSRITNDPNPTGVCAADFPAEFSKPNPVTSAAFPQGQGKYFFGTHADDLADIYVNEVYPRLARKLKTAVLVEAP